MENKLVYVYLHLDQVMCPWCCWCVCCEDWFCTAN